ncbi:MAG: hypothetical protein CSYNP_03107 [Syntrophus sp. SKADARSKE-3]|nr:hypothetical protein [Syntrophus sp. SKADARSKE-3]
MDKATLYSDLEWIEKKASYKQAFELFYKLAQVRYATFKQLHPLNHRVATKPNLVRFVEQGYLFTHDLVKNQPAYSITEKARKILNFELYNTKILQKNFTGQSLDHALKITDCLLKLQASPEFYNVFYPFFREPPDYKSEFLRPDFCVIWKKENSYKIQFGEVEQPKANWDNYLLIKRANYERLASDKNLYDIWWSEWSKRLNLPMCKKEDFCFSVLCVGNIKKEWSGWKFEC